MRKRFLCILLAMVLLCLCALLLRELGNLGNILPDLSLTAKSSFSLLRNWLLQLSSHTPKSLRPVLEQNVNRFFSDGAALLDKATGYLLGLAGSLLTHVPDSALSLGTALISAGSFLPTTSCHRQSHNSNQNQRENLLHDILLVILFAFLKLYENQM